MPDRQLRFSFDPPSDPVPATIFIRHRRARRYILRVLADGTLRVTLPRWGSKREARGFIDASQDWIAQQRARRKAQAPVERRDHGIVQHVERWWRAKAERELPEMLLLLAEKHGIAVTRVSIRDQRSRWGACSARGSITLNWRLIRLPDFVREYIMLHELMHRRELNHSRRFWHLVASCCPRHLEARQWLKSHGASGIERSSD
jgi:predicted metal-dependent hydrolase